MNLAVIPLAVFLLVLLFLVARHTPDGGGDD